jgi:hypothetical protein
MNPVFATKAQAEKLLGENDIYTTNLKPFELKAKLQTVEEVTTEDYLSHARNQALDWSDDLKQKVNSALDEISLNLSINPMPLPDEVIFVMTTGLEEANAAYTRGNAIFLNKRMIQQHWHFSRLIAHELVHVATRNNTNWKNRLYSTIGFQPCKLPYFSDEFQDFLFSNPDAPLIQHSLKLTFKGIKQRISPIIFTRKNEYVGGRFFDYIETGLFLLDGSNETEYELFPEEKRIIPFDECQEFFEHVGRNTDYLFHAEEILADNIADIYTGRVEFPSPNIVRKILNVLNVESF